MMKLKWINVGFLRAVNGLKMEAELEDEFDRRKETSARRQIVAALAAALVLTTLGLIVDAQAGILTEALILKLSLQMPALLAGILVAQQWNVAPKQIWVVGALPFFITVVVVTLLAVATDPPFAARYATIAGLAALLANIVLPIAFKASLLLTAANVVAFVSIPTVFQPHSYILTYVDVIFFMSAVSIVSVAHVYKREEVHKENFLLVHINKRQATELRELVKKLTKLAHRDPMTGVGNRRSFDMRFEAAWRTAEGRREELALILIDVDHFKLFNDAAGHSAGDECLRAVAVAIAQGADIPMESVTRYGGEEFAVILQSTTGRIAETIRQCVAALALPHPGLPAGSCVSVSIGKAFARPGTTGISPEDLVKAADTALYEAKRGGRNRVVIAGYHGSIAA